MRRMLRGITPAIGELLPISCRQGCSEPRQEQLLSTVPLRVLRARQDSTAAPATLGQTLDVKVLCEGARRTRRGEARAFDESGHAISATSIQSGRSPRAASQVFPIRSTKRPGPTDCGRTWQRRMDNTGTFLEARRLQFQTSSQPCAPLCSSSSDVCRLYGNKQAELLRLSVPVQASAQSAWS